MPGDTSHEKLQRLLQRLPFITISRTHTCAPISVLSHSLTYTHKSFLMLPATTPTHTDLKWICVSPSLSASASLFFSLCACVCCTLQALFHLFIIFLSHGFESVQSTASQSRSKQQTANMTYFPLFVALFVNKIVFHFVFLVCYFDGCLQVLRSCSCSFVHFFK